MTKCSRSRFRRTGLLTGSSDGTARLWSAQTGNESRVLSGHEKGAYSVAFSPDGSLLATGSLDGTTRLWSAETGDEIRVLRGGEGTMSPVAFSPSGKLVATGGWDGTVKLWYVPREL